MDATIHKRWEISFLRKQDFLLKSRQGLSQNHPVANPQITLLQFFLKANHISKKSIFGFSYVLSKFKPQDCSLLGVSVIQRF